MGTLSTLIVNLELNSAKYRKELNKSKKTLNKFSKEVGKAMKSAAKATLALGVAAGVALAVVYKNTSKSMDQLAKFADRIGMSTESLVGLRYAAERTGVAQAQLDMGLQRMTRRIAEAAKGTGEAVKALDELGLSAEALAKLSPDRQFAAIAGKMKEVAVQGDRVRLSMKLFDSEGVALVNTLALGTDGLTAMQAKAEALGITFSRIDAAKIEIANDILADAALSSNAFGIAITTGLSPIVAALSEEFEKASKEAGGIGNLGATAVDVMIGALGSAADAGRTMGLTWLGAEVAVANYLKMVAKAGTLGPKVLGKGLEWLGVENNWLSEIATQADGFAAEVDRLTAKFDKVILEPPPSDKIKQWVEDAQAKMQKAAEEVSAKNKLNIGGTLTGGDTDGGTKSEAELAEIKRILKAQKEKFAGIHEEALRADGKLVDLETFRLEREEEQFLADMALLSERGLLNRELMDEFRLQDEEAERIHQSNLFDIKKEQLKKEAALQKAKWDRAKAGFEFVASLAKKDSKLQRIALAASKLVGLNEAKIALQVAIAKANKVGFPQNIPVIAEAVVIGAGAISNIKGIAHGGLDNVPKEATYLLDKGERVLSPKQNNDLVDFMASSQTKQLGALQVIINEAPGVSAEVSLDDGTLTVDMLREDLINGGEISQLLTETHDVERIPTRG